MEKNRSHTTERILNLTLEIIYLLTGENYIAFKLADGLVATNMKKTQSLNIDPPSQSIRKNNKKVEEVTNEIIELLTGEVPIRCEDSSVPYPMEVWEYIEGHKVFCKDVMMEKRPPLTSPEGSSKRNPPERCPRPLRSQNVAPDRKKILQEYKVTLEVNQTDQGTETMDESEGPYMMGDESCKEEEDPPEISTDPGNSRTTPKYIKDEEEEEEEEELMRIKEEDVPVEISNGTFAIKVMSAPVTERERRKKNFSKEERAIVISALSRYDVYLHGALSRHTSKVMKNEMLQEVTMEVNALGHERRSTKDIAKKINDLRRHVREKLGKIRKHARGTGGGPASSLQLTDEEEVIARCLSQEQVEGIEGFDSTDQDLWTDLLEGAGPSDVGVRPTPPPKHPVPHPEPLGSQTDDTSGTNPSPLPATKRKTTT